MAKSRDAFRTISEVSDWLGTPAHVLRFWESRFKQIKPVKRAGGRRYYRPSDMFLLGGIRRLLHDDGMTIKGVQKILREKGVKHVTSLCEETLEGAENRGGIEESTAPDAPAPFADTEPTVAQYTDDNSHDQATNDISPIAQAVNEIAPDTRLLRISELYHRLKTLRNRVRASKG